MTFIEEVLCCYCCLRSVVSVITVNRKEVWLNEKFVVVKADFFFKMISEIDDKDIIAKFPISFFFWS